MASVIAFPDRLERARLRYEAASRLPAEKENWERYQAAKAELLEAQRERFYRESAG